VEDRNAEALVTEPILAAIEAAGGWRRFMRDASESPELAQCALSDASVSRYPRAALGRAFYLAKMGDPRGARAALDAFDKALAGRLASDADLQRERLLVDAHVAVYEDKAYRTQDAFNLRRLLRQIPEDDIIGQALACNHLCTMALHLGDFDMAQDYAEQAIRLFQRDGAEFGSLHLRTHLGQIRMLRGDLRGAEAQYREMEERLSRLPGNPEWLIAAGRVLHAEVAYEMNDLERSAEMMRHAFSAVEQKDAWSDILVAAYRVRTRLAFAHSGLPGALEALSDGERIARQREMPRLHRLMQIERARALTLSDEIDAAREAMTHIGLSPDRPSVEDTDDWALRQGTTIVAMARWLVRARRARQAIEFIGPAADFAIRGGQLLSLAKLRVIAAAAHWTLGARTEATGSLLSAVRLLGRQPFRRFILDEGPRMRFIVEAALNGDHVAVPPTRDQRRRLSELTHYWATSGRTGFPLAEAGETALRRRYLELLALGHSNKEMAQVMGVSANTVKYHLKRIFRELDADNRTRAVQRARDLGLIED
jgi:ATP/maltotriose-dependent transcriptional regulator MalT